MYLRVSATHGVTDQVQTDYGDINLERARYALDVVDDGQGGYMCADQIARISGCVPFNPFALNGISNDAVDYLSADTGLKGEVQQTVLNATLSGELDFSVTDNVMNIGFASGIEYREEKGQETPDPLRQAGIARGNQIAKTKGSFDVVDIFGELNIPIVEQLNINLAARYGDYSSVGETFNWTVNIDAPISDSFRLRGAVATAVRAPNVSDLFAGGAATSAIVTDPCNGIDAASTGNIAENCRSIDAIQRRIDNQGAFVLTQVESQNTSGLLSGSEDVGEEKADTLTAGFVFIPEQIDGLQLSVDYYNIEIDDAIAKTDRTVILNRCYSQSPSNFDPDCGGLVRRDGRTGAALDVNAASGNENKIETAGVDIDISYETALGSGDLYVAFKIKEHDYFVRDGINIKYRLPINIAQASLGTKIEVPTLDGYYEIEIPPGTQTGRIFRVRGRGVAQLRGDRRGDLLVLIDVRIPKKLDSQQQKLMNELGESLPETFEDDEDKGIFDKFRSAFTN
ncbi:MAG: hypothetical protein CL894_03480 [Dehalococcoidia bacterium]|nr:hypothetical protein [Dehalococcoidia bacterium]